MLIRGTMTELNTFAGRTTFLLRATDGTDTRVQTSAPIPPGFKNGDEVIVNGENPTDPPFLAESVFLATKSAGKPSRKILWIAAAAIAIALIALIIARSQSGGTGSWTLQALDGTTPAGNVPVELLDDQGRPVSTETTAVGTGRVTFDLAKGSYSAKGPGGAIVNATFTGKMHIESTLPVASPFMWTVRTTSCGRAAGNIPLTVVGGGVPLPAIQTDAAGEYKFTNLSRATYQVHSSSGKWVGAIINGTNKPSTAVVDATPPSMHCLVIPFDRVDRLSDIHRLQSPRVLPNR